MSPRKVHTVEIAAELEDPDFAWGTTGKLKIEWRGTAVVDHSVSWTIAIINVWFTAGLGIIVDAVTGALFVHPRDQRVEVQLSPGPDADKRRRDYVEKELSAAQELQKRRDVFGAARLLQQAGSACAQRQGFADLETRSRDALKTMEPSLQAIRETLRFLAGKTLTMRLEGAESSRVVRFNQQGAAVSYREIEAKGPKTKPSYLTEEEARKNREFFQRELDKLHAAVGEESWVITGFQVDGWNVAISWVVQFSRYGSDASYLIRGRIDPATNTFSGEQESNSRFKLAGIDGGKISGVFSEGR